MPGKYINTSDRKTRHSSWGCLRHRQCLVPTRRGWFLILLALAAFGLTFLKTIHPFLAVTDSRPGGALVVEGWASDDVMTAAIAEFKSHPYSRLYSTGGPLDTGAPLSEYKTHAQMGAATLARMGFDTNYLQAVPAPVVRQDRTYSAAVALGAWLRQHNLTETNFNLITSGPHARRSRLMFEKALGRKVGIIAIAPQGYDPKRWWTSSNGFRNLTDELIAYIYARFFFWPSRPQ